MWLLLAPALLVSAGVILIPSLLTLAAAFTEWSGLGAPRWVGLANFRALLGDRVFWLALANNLRWTAIFLVLPMLLGLVVAALLLSLRRGRTLLQALYFIPFILATVVSARVWQAMIYNPRSGLFGWLNSLGLSLRNPLARPESALYGVAAVDMWHWWGFLAVVFLAAMRQIDRALLDAARVEGAGFWQLFRFILLPLIRPTILFMAVMTVIWSFLVFDFIYVLTQGGPAHASEVLSTLAYRRAFSEFAVGRAAAIASVISLFGLSATAMYVRLQFHLERW